MKKLIAVILICCMVLPILPASATEEATAQPTIEEILNSYHEKAFAAQTAEESGGVSTYARGGSSQTLEQETVAELTAAGYEAYNVTGDNYDAVEDTLNTDLATLGLDPESSYVVVVSGEDPAAQSNTNSRSIDPPTHEHIGGSGDSQYFDYTYNGNTFLMRYVTVTSSGDDEKAVSSIYAPTEPSLLEHIMDNLFSTCLGSIADSNKTIIPISSIVSLLDPDDYIFAEITPSTFAIHATTYWTLVFIQVWDSSNQIWVTSQSSEYTDSMVFCVGSAPDPNTGRPVSKIGTAKYIQNYSLNYLNEDQRKRNAIIAYNQYTIYADAVYDVDFYICTQDGEIIMGTVTTPLFTHTRKAIPHLPNS